MFYVWAFSWNIIPIVQNSIEHDAMFYWATLYKCNKGTLVDELRQKEWTHHVGGLAIEERNFVNLVSKYQKPLSSSLTLVY